MYITERFNKGRCKTVLKGDCDFENKIVKYISFQIPRDFIVVGLLPNQLILNDRGKQK